MDLSFFAGIGFVWAKFFGRALRFRLLRSGLGPGAIAEGSWCGLRSIEARVRPADSGCRLGEESLCEPGCRICPDSPKLLIWGDMAVGFRSLASFRTIRSAEIVGPLVGSFFSTWLAADGLGVGAAVLRIAGLSSRFWASSGASPIVSPARPRPPNDRHAGRSPGGACGVGTACRRLRTGPVVIPAV